MRMQRRAVSNTLAQERQQILAVFVVDCSREPLQLGSIDKALAVGNFLDASNLQALPGLDRLHELRRLQQSFVRAGVEPGKPAAEPLNVKLAALEVGPIHISNFQLAA